MVPFWYAFMKNDKARKVQAVQEFSLPSFFLMSINVLGHLPELR